MRRVILLATLGVMSTVATAVAGEKPHRPAGASGRSTSMVSKWGEPIIRPPESIPLSRGHPHPVTSSPPSSTDRHVAEFLRWKDQHAPR
jgi:hypothetical protein